VFLDYLRLYNFKNYAEVEVRPDPKINCFLGKNGCGKTNLLDAIHYLAFTKSAINPSDIQNIRFEQNQFLVKGRFSVEGRLKEIVCAYQQGQKKNVREDDQDYLKFSDHVGKYPVVLITPQDIELIWGGGEQRRRFFDTLLSQLDRFYLENLIIYNHQVKQRNSLLRKFSEAGSVDSDLLGSYDHRICIAGNYIHQSRKNLLKEFIPKFKKHYRFIAQESEENIEVEYRSDLDQADFATQLKNHIHRDILLQRTTCGIHRDDFLFLLNGGELKKFGSQGQQKSFLISLKLSEFEVIAEKKGLKPILLLDDIFDKLDDSRIHHLMKLVAEGMFGQLFITDARLDRSSSILKEAGIEAKIFVVENGNLKLNGQNTK
jgi:DNA replication and repair protein RecF